MSETSLFTRILDEPYRVVPESYLIATDGLVADILATLKYIHPATALMRTYIETLPHYPYDEIDLHNSTPVLIDMEALASKVSIDRREIYAIDGTPATPHLHYSSNQLFAVAVVGMSYATLDTPETFLATTRTAESWEESPDKTAWESVVRWLEEVDILETNQSWPTTFREYVERDYAITKHFPMTILDGPILTQNLVTQMRGREKILELLQQPFLTCGVIKSLYASTIAHRLLALALKPGEALLIEPSYQLIKRRTHLRNETWVDKFFQEVSSHGLDIWRGVYRPATRAFGFECHFGHLDQVTGLLWTERDTHHLGHEIPFLLNQVDAHLRASFNARHCQDHLTYMMGLDLAESQLFDEINEREFR